MSGCTNFVPNLWKPLLCSNCLQCHTSASAPPSPSIPTTSTSHYTPISVRIGIPRPNCPLLSSCLTKSQKKQLRQPSHEHKRSHSTPVQSTTSPSSSNVPLPSLHVLTHTESAKRKKGGSSVVCDSFLPQRWRPTICMHCFEPITLHPFTRAENYMNTLVHMDISSPLQDDGNGEDDTTTSNIATQTPLPETPRAQDMDDTLLKLRSLTFSPPPTSSGRRTPPPSSGRKTPPLRTPLQISTNGTASATSTPRTILLPITPRSLQRPSTAPSPTRSFDDDDPFRDFEDLQDSTLAAFNSYSQGFEIATAIENVPFGPLRTLRSSRGREQFFSKYRDEDDEGGVDMDVESFVAMAEYSYVNNKIMEIASVKEEAERSQAVMQDNPTVVTALYEILTAKQMQIQKALAREKINEQDHSKLLERLNAVKALLKPNQGATW